MNADEVATHMAKALEAAPPSFTPWNHVVVDKIFPAAFYAEIERAFGASEHLFSAQVHTGDRDVFTAPYELRSQFKVAEEATERQTQGETWDTLWAALNSQTFWVALKRVLSEELMERYDDYMGHPQFREHLDGTLLVTRHSEGYHLGPHTDRAEKVVTCIFNVAEGEGLEHLGTTLYKAQQEGFKSNGRRHFDFDKFELIKTAPFRPNSALFFARRDESFHGVEPMTAETMHGSNRKNIQFNLWDWGRRPAA